MSVSKKTPRSALGDNPLSQGIFSKTEPFPASNPPEAETGEGQSQNQDSTLYNQDSSIKNLDSGIENQETRVNNQESRFLRKGAKESVNLRLPIELNDWLNDLLRNGKRRHGAKIPKEIWLQAALELFRSLPVDWENVEDEDGLRRFLNNLESRFKNLEIITEETIGSSRGKDSEPATKCHSTATPLFQ
jgi:hypothetical protein